MNMKLLFTRLLIALLFFFSVNSVFGQLSTANQSVKPYTANFGYGSNMGYYGSSWSDKSLVTLVSKAGGNSVRPKLPETFVDQWGYPIRLSEFQYYANELGMTEITCFIEGPTEGHRDLTIYPGCTSSSRIFAKLYEPIWNADGTVNPNNYYANYVYKLVQTYGPYIKNWEVVNEPDLGANNPAEWLTRAPLPSELSNLRAPFYHYIRMLRITWEVVKKYNPDDYVTPGGIGHSNFLDALLRYTDNPNGGAVTSQYPNKGGAYFDMLSYHLYPTFYLRKWDNAIGGFKYLRNSDYAAAQVVGHKDWLQTVLDKYGYNGVAYPKKHFIVTETNISRRAVDWRYSSDVMQRNFGIKTLVLAQKKGIKQVHFFATGESVDAPTTETISSSIEYSLMGLYENLKRDLSGSEKLSPLGKGFKTTSKLLLGYAYDATRTAALNLTAAVEGGAFKKDGEYVYVLWAKNPNDKSETYSQPYSFPTALSIAKVDRFEWDYALTGTNTQQLPTGITLNTAPSFFKASGTTTVTKQNQSITFGAISSKVYGAAPFALQATATSSLAVSFRVVSGPATISGTTITLTGVGTVTVEAIQSGNTTYSAAPAVSQSFAVTAATTTTPTATTRIEAEKYTSMSGVSTEGTADTGGGLNVGRLDANDWLKFTVSVSAAGTYNLNFRVAGYSGGQFQVRNGSGAVLKTLDVPVTGGWQSWRTVSVPVALSAGSQTLQVYVTKSGWNFNWFEIGTSATIAVASSPSTKIEAEKYTSMSGVGTETTTDTGGGLNVNSLAANDWMKYTVSVSATSTYTLNFRVASSWGGSFEIRNSSGTVLKTLSVPKTGGWQTWRTISAAVPLVAGSQTIQIYVKGSGWNFNWFEIGTGTTSATTAVTGSKSQFTEDLTTLEQVPAAEMTCRVYPNPVITAATVEVYLKETMPITLEVCNMQGKVVRQLFAGTLEANTIHPFTLETNGLAAGIYFTRLITPAKIYNQKIIVKGQ